MGESPEVTHVKIYKDVGGETRWTAYAANGESVAVSSEGYQNHLDARGAAGALFPAAVLHDELDAKEGS